MTSNEERHEIAEKLRAYPDDGMALRHMCRALGIKGNFYVARWTTVFKRLADLIDGGTTSNGTR